MRQERQEKGTIPLSRLFDKRTKKRKISGALSLSEHSIIEGDRRKHAREKIRVPFRLSLQGNDVFGDSLDITPGGLCLASRTGISAGTPLALQCTFGEIGYLDLSGQVVYCRPLSDENHQEHSIGVKFSAIREWERKILVSAIQELRQTKSKRENSLLTISGTKDSLALESSDFYVRSQRTTSPKVVRKTSLYASKVIGWGSYLPDQEITNQDVNLFLSVQGKTTRFGDVVGALTGIQSRRYASSNLYPSDLAAKAAVRALKNAGVDPKDLEVVIFCGVSRDVEEPATASIVQEKIGAQNAYSFDLTNACNGFVSSLDVLDSFIASNRYDIGLVVAGEVISQYINWKPTSKEELKLSAMGYTLGDGGGAAVLCRKEAGDHQGIRASWFLSDSSYWKVAVVPLINETEKIFKSNGPEIEHAALEYVPLGVKETLKILHWDLNEVDLFVPHQVSSHIIEPLFFKKLGVPPEKVFWSYPKHGNVGAASMPVALCNALAEKKARPGDKILLVGGSGGFGVGIMGLVL